jgi:hypothetical protein
MAGEVSWFVSALAALSTPPLPMASVPCQAHVFPMARRSCHRRLEHDTHRQNVSQIIKVCGLDEVPNCLWQADHTVLPVCPLNGKNRIGPGYVLSWTTIAEPLLGIFLVFQRQLHSRRRSPFIKRSGAKMIHAGILVVSLAFFLPIMAAILLLDIWSRWPPI